MKFPQAMLDLGMVQSKSEAARLIKEGAVRFTVCASTEEALRRKAWMKVELGDEFLSPHPAVAIRIANRRIAIAPAELLDGKNSIEIAFADVADNDVSDEEWEHKLAAR